MPRIDAIGVTSTDLPRTIAFYTLLGFDFPAFDPEAVHVEPETPPGAPRLMIDTAALMEEITGRAPVPASHSAFALLCDSAAEVDSLTAAVADAGFKV